MVSGEEAQLPRTGPDNIPDIDLDDPVPLLRVYDGDTVEVKIGTVTERVRMKGINTPELNLPDGPAEPWAEAALAFSEAHAGNVVQIEFDSGCPSPPLELCRDAFDRLLAYVRVSNGDDLGAELLSAGLARVFRFNGETFDRLEEYEDLEAEAEADGTGLWGD